MYGSVRWARSDPSPYRDDPTSPWVNKCRVGCQHYSNLILGSRGACIRGHERQQCARDREFEEFRRQATGSDRCEAVTARRGSRYSSEKQFTSTSCDALRIQTCAA